MAALREIVFDCRHAPSLARFWASVLDGYAVRPYDDAEVARLASMGRTPETDPVVLVDGPGPVLCFQQVPEGKVGKNRVHLDVDVGSADRPTEVDRLVRLGAAVAGRFDGWTVLRDPEGNEFCVADSR